MGSNPEGIMVTIVQTAGGMAAIALSFLGIFLGVFAGFAEGDEHGGRAPILKLLRNGARVSAFLAAVSAASVCLALAWLILEREALFWMSLALFVADVGLVVLTSVVVVWKFFR